jgi:hypothetical protein
MAPTNSLQTSNDPSFFQDDYTYSFPAKAGNYHKQIMLSRLTPKLLCNNILSTKVKVPAQVTSKSYRKHKKDPFSGVFAYGLPPFLL